RKFAALVTFFRQYGDEYDLPYLLLAAQGYQESQLDQNRRSHAGAVGVMQIKPSTAEGPPVFIKGVDKDVEANIHAGAKYLRWIVDEYYKDEPMTKVDKGLFALASYNAGAGRISGLRRRAKRMGLDENKWFQNVEIVVAREIGRETVQYVGNIYKYYVAYDLVAQQRLAARGELRSAEKAHAWFDRTGVQGVVALRPVSRQTETTYSPVVWSSGYYQSFWGYYPYGWTNVYVARASGQSTTVVVETLVY